MVAMKMSWVVQKDTRACWKILHARNAIVHVGSGQRIRTQESSSEVIFRLGGQSTSLMALSPWQPRAAVSRLVSLRTPSYSHLPAGQLKKRGGGSLLRLSKKSERAM